MSMAPGIDIYLRVTICDKTFYTDGVGRFSINGILLLEAPTALGVMAQELGLVTLMKISTR